VMDGAWHFTLVPYAWFSGISGDVSVANRVVPFEESFSDLVKDVKCGAQLHFDARKDRVGLAVDVMYADISAPVDSSAPELGGLSIESEVRQTYIEGIAFYRVASGGRADNPAHLDLLAGARYLESRSQLSARTEAGQEYDGKAQDVNWVDAVVGAKFLLPLGSRFALLGRGDLAGLGSKLTWSLEGDVGFRASNHWYLGMGWRHMDIDYDEGQGLHRKLFDIAYDGPRVWFSYCW
jgi:hypothetical protein